MIDLTKILSEMGVYDLISNKPAEKKNRIEDLKNVRSTGVFSNHSVGIPVPGKRNNLALAFTTPKVRTRMIMIYSYSYLKNLLVAGTLNKTEYMVGPYDRYGDGACDIAPIRNLYKTQIRQLASYLEIPKKIVEKTPTPDLFAGKIINVEFLVGMPLERLDAILYCLEQGMEYEEIARQLNIDENVVKETAAAIPAREILRQMPLVPKI